MTKPQLQEIKFLEDNFCGKTTNKEKEDYIAHTVKGKKVENNKLIGAKQKLDIQVKMWREDLTIGLFSVKELKEDFKSDYFNNLIDSVLKSVTKEYRQEKLSKGIGTVLAITNFDNVIESMRK